MGVVLCRPYDGCRPILLIIWEATMNDPQSSKLDQHGRLVVPASIRRELELRGGDEVVFSRGDIAGEVKLLTRGAALRHAREVLRPYIPAGGNLVDAFLAERRKEALREARHTSRRAPRK
jgi:AbrB family looped-hinge helix DNA binding protein